MAQSLGAGTHSVTFPLESGDWTVVVMNADGQAAVSADLAVGATVPGLRWLVAILLSGGRHGSSSSVSCWLSRLCRRHGRRRRCKVKVSSKELRYIGNDRSCPSGSKASPAVCNPDGLWTQTGSARVTAEADPASQITSAKSAAVAAATYREI